MKMPPAVGTNNTVTNTGSAFLAEPFKTSLFSGANGAAITVLGAETINNNIVKLHVRSALGEHSLPLSAPPTKQTPTSVLASIKAGDLVLLKQVSNGVQAAVVSTQRPGLRGGAPVTDTEWEAGIERWANNPENGPKESLKIAKNRILDRYYNSGTVLDLAGLKLQKMPADLSKLRSLEWLDLSNTQINDITVLQELRSLERLDLSNNQIEDFSPLDQHPKLSANRIEEIKNSPQQRNDTRSIYNTRPDTSYTYVPPPGSTREDIRSNSSRTYNAQQELQKPDTSYSYVPPTGTRRENVYSNLSATSDRSWQGSRTTYDYSSFNMDDIPSPSEPEIQIQMGEDERITILTGHQKEVEHMIIVGWATKLINDDADPAKLHHFKYFPIADQNSSSSEWLAYLNYETRDLYCFRDRHINTLVEIKNCIIQELELKPEEVGIDRRTQVRFEHS